MRWAAEVVQVKMRVTKTKGLAVWLLVVRGVGGRPGSHHDIDFHSFLLFSV